MIGLLNETPLERKEKKLKIRISDNDINKLIKKERNLARKRQFFIG